MRKNTFVEINYRDYGLGAIRPQDHGQFKEHRLVTSKLAELLHFWRYFSLVNDIAASDEAENCRVVSLAHWTVLRAQTQVCEVTDLKNTELAEWKVRKEITGLKIYLPLGNTLLNQLADVPATMTADQKAQLSIALPVCVDSEAWSVLEVALEIDLREHLTPLPTLAAPKQK
jgi:hypothetical protein